MIKWITDWMFGEKQWQEIAAMNDEELKWEFCRLLSESNEGRYDVQRFRRICYQMAIRFERQDSIPCD